MHYQHRIRGRICLIHITECTTLPLDSCISVSVSVSVSAAAASSQSQSQAVTVTSSTYSLRMFQSNADHTHFSCKMAFVKARHINRLNRILTLFMMISYNRSRHIYVYVGCYVAMAIVCFTYCIDIDIELLQCSGMWRRTR